MKVLQITPWEPPASGWTTRVRLLRRVIHEQGGACEILDIGPSRLVDGRDCIPVKSGTDYVKKVVRFARDKYIIHAHINGRYFRGMLLMLCAALIARAIGNGYVLTFHGGHIQPFLNGWKRQAVRPVLFILFSLSHKVICNSEKVKNLLIGFAPGKKIVPIPAFSRQYLEYEKVNFDGPLASFCHEKTPLVLSYLCFRPEFSVESVVAGLELLHRTWPTIGLVVVGTGDGRADFERSIEQLGLSKHVHIAGDVSHDAFLTLISRCDVMVRTHVADGVSATLLEALALGIPIVASENQTRPEGVITYVPDNAEDMVKKVHHILKNRSEVARDIRIDEVPDTASVEVELILSAAA